jgi:hypothetical protein
VIFDLGNARGRPGGLFGENALVPGLHFAAENYLASFGAYRDMRRIQLRAAAQRFLDAILNFGHMDGGADADQVGDADHAREVMHCVFGFRPLKTPRNLPGQGHDPLLDLDADTVGRKTDTPFQALLALGRPAGLELWGTARGEHAALIRELGATPIDYQREDFTRVLPGRFDIVFDGIGEDGYRRSFIALKRGGLLCAYGYSAGVQARRRMLTMLMWIARLYLLRWLPGGKRARFYSINVMRARHPAWFREDLERLFGLLETRAIRPRVAQRISFDEVAEAHRRLEEGGLEGKLVLCPDLPSRGDRVPLQPERGSSSVHARSAT